MILTYRTFRHTLLLFVLLLCLPVFAQDKPVVRIAVTLPTGGVQGIANPDIRDRLVKTLNQHKSDKKLKISVEAVALDAPPGGAAVAAAAKKNCQFILYSRLKPLQGSHHFERTADGSVTNTPTVTATLEYLLRGVADGGSYASGSAKSDESFSDKDAVLEAAGRSSKAVLGDLANGGGVNRSQTADATFLQETTPSTGMAPTTNGNFCDWLSPDLRHSGAVRGVCEYAMTLPQKMPNFVCQQETSRYEGHNRVPSDLITATVTYEDGDESYSDLRLNGKPVADVMTKAAGLWSSGQFEGNLRDIFHEANHPDFKFVREEQYDGRAAWVFSFRIARQNEAVWQLRAEDQVVAPPYEGELWIDEQTGAVVRFHSTAKDLPTVFPMQSAEIITDYGNVEFGDGTTFVLPVASSIATQFQDQKPTRNVVRFRGCHKFRAKARMVLNLPGEVPSGESAAAAREELKAELEQNTTIYEILREQAIREDDARLEVEQQRDLAAATAAALQKLAALRQEQQKLVERESAVAKSAAPEKPASPGIPVFRVSVNLVPVSVVPRNSTGHAVGNLNKENFHLFDERKPQVITKFTVEKNDTPAAPREQTDVAADQATAEIHRTVPSENDIAYVFDDIGLSREDLSASAAAAGNHLAEMRQEDRAALFTTSGEVGVNFTADKDRLLAALKTMKPHPMPGWNCPPMSYYEADLIVNHADVDAGNLAEGEAMGCSQAYTAGQARRLAASRALEVVNTGRANSEQTLGILGEVIARTSAMTGRRMIVLISPGFVTVAPDSQDKAMALIDRALQAGIVVNTLDATGLEDTPESNAQGNLSRSQFDRHESLARSEVMADLAYGTGGTYFHRNNNMNEGFRQTAETPEFIYVLGFSPQKLDGKFHKLKVTLNSPEKLSVQARPGYYAVKSVPSP